jgi:hypothetical protein
MQMPFARPIARIAAPLALLAAAACDAGTGTGRVPVSVSFSGQSPAATLASGMSADVTVSDAGNTLVITKVQVILREVELKRASSVQCSDDSTSTDSSNDDCEELSIGPFLVDVPVTGNTVTSIAATVAADTYREIEFEIHKLGDDTPAEREIAAAHPEFDTNSIRVEGTFNGTPFVFLSELDVEIEQEFSVPVAIAAGDENVTIQFDLSEWFRNGSVIINPATANKGGPNESLVRENIRTSIRAFADNDRDGH